MISSKDSCRQLVAGNYDVILDDDEIASFKSVLTEFLSRFEHHENELLDAQQHQQQQQCSTSPSEAGSYVNEFKMLKELSKALKEDSENFIDGLEFYNQSKNRYKDIIPFNHTRVILNSIPELEPGSNYINANYVRGPSGSPRSYIACQGPLPHTLNDFWRMIWECRVSVVVMACNEQEMGKSKCEQYWPSQVNGTLVYGNIQVTLMRVRQINSDFLIRKFSVQLLESEEKSQDDLGRPPAESPLIQDQQFNQAPVEQNGKVQHHDSQQTNSDSNNNNMAMTNSTNTTATINVNANQYPSRQDNNDAHSFGNSGGNSSTSNESINTSDYSTTNLGSSQTNPQHPHLDQRQANKLHQSWSGTRSNRAVLMERTVCQFHFQGWQDHGVPDSVQSILELVRLIREVQPGYSPSILVHCSAGCGRTGTICCIDYVYGLMRMGRLRSNFDLFTIISEMRQQRMAMVQTIEQYILCHRAVAALFMQQLQILGFGINQSRCIAMQKTDDNNSAINEHSSGDPDRSTHYDTSSSTDEHQSSNSKCSFEQDEEDHDEDQELGPVFI